MRFIYLLNSETAMDEEKEKRRSAPPSLGIPADKPSGIQRLVKAISKKFTLRRYQSAPVEVSAQADVHARVSKVWSEATTIVAKDLPRLGRRVTIMDRDTVVLSLGELPEFIEDQDPMAGAVMQRRAGNIIRVLIRLLDPPELLGRLDEELWKDIPGLDFEDIQQSLLELFSGCLAETRTLRVLQSTHQVIVVQVAFRVKTLLGELGRLRDVRGDGGWAILIELLDSGRVLVTHKRKEQNSTPEDEPGHVKINWQVSMDFNRDVSALLHTRVQVNEVEFSEGTDEEFMKVVYGFIDQDELFGTKPHL